MLSTLEYVKDTIILKSIAVVVSVNASWEPDAVEWMLGARDSRR
jgi:hypothetical protein